MSANASLYPGYDAVRHSEGIRGDGKARVDTSRGWHERGVGDIEIFDLVRAAIAIKHAGGRIFAETYGSAGVGEVELRLECEEHRSLATQSALQQATELAPNARSSAVALHAFFFFIGLAVGPAIFGLGVIWLGVPSTLLICAIGCAAAGLIGAWAMNARGSRRLAA